MIRFESDYLEGAHPKILEKLFQTNLDQSRAYGNDEYCESARNKIAALCNNDSVDVHFLSGGTQCNLTVMAAALKSYQAVVCAQTGHINVHETGAIEATGHKVITLDSLDGKINASQIFDLYNSHINDSNKEHIAQPKMVYISNPTENGTIYLKDELYELSRMCKKCGMFLYMDGARLGYGLTSSENDLTIEDISNCCDVFYIGGTKVGALLGEALVITNKDIQKDFRYNIKQRGALLAKGRVLGIMFDVLFENNLYFEIAKHANLLSNMIKKTFESKGYSFLYNSYTNQIFPILPNYKIEKLKEKYSFEYWCKVDDWHSAVRFCTSWATKESDVNQLIEDIKNL